MDDLKKDYARYRLEKAKEEYEAAVILLESETIEQIGNAKMFLEHIEKYVEEKLGE